MPATGERVGLFLEPGRESIATLLGVFAAGAIAVPLAVHATAAEVDHVLQDSGARTVIGAAALAEKAGGARFIERDTLLTSAVSRSEAATNHTAPALILYTSGTTSLPKGAVHTHAGLINQVAVLHDAWGWTSEDCLLHVLPMHHIHGLVNGALGALWARAELYFLPRFETTRVWRALASGEVSVFYAVPTMYFQLLEALNAQPAAVSEAWASAVRRLRLAVSGSAALPATLWQRWFELTGQPLLERYGMTETGMIISNPYLGERRPGTVGQPLPSMDVRIVNENGEEAGSEPGEIWVRGPSLFTGYWGQPESTALAFRDGYFRTGDIAEVTDGFVRILGRASVDIIKSAGYKLSALEIEDAISSHAAVAEVAVVGVPSEQWGEVVTACVVLRPGTSLSLEELRAWCGDRLSPYKHPRSLRLLTALPRNAMGKVVKQGLRQPSQS